MVDLYRDDGAVLIRGAFDQGWVDLMRSGIAKNMADPSGYSESLRVRPGEGAYFNDYCNWSRIPEFRRVVFESPAGEIAGRLMGGSKRYTCRTSGQSVE